MVKKFCVNTSCARSSTPVVSLAVKSRGWSEEPLPGRGDVQWVVTEDDLDTVLAAVQAPGKGGKARKAKRLSRIPGMHQLCHKVPFARLLNVHKARAPDAFDFWPATWVVGLPGGGAGAVPGSAFKKGRPLIFKPDDGGQGDGIYLILSKQDLDRRLASFSGAGVVQRYLEDPLLINGQYKFDLRLYAVVLSLEPLRVYLCREGLVRVCVDPYAAPSPRNAHKVTAHLTNYSVNKLDPNFEHHDDPQCGDHGNKRCLDATLAFLEQSGQIDRGAVWAGLKRVVAETSKAMAEALQPGEGRPGRAAPPAATADRAPSLAELWGERQMPRSGSSCFNILGFDVMLDSQGRPHLLEVNVNPSLVVDSVYPVTGPKGADLPCPPPLPPPGASPLGDLAHACFRQLGLKAGLKKPCKCMSHHRPHIHFPCLCDLQAKSLAVLGVLDIIRRDLRAKKTTSNAELASGTAYELVYEDAPRLPKHPTGPPAQSDSDDEDVSSGDDEASASVAGAFGRMRLGQAGGGAGGGGPPGGPARPPGDPADGAWAQGEPEPMSIQQRLSEYRSSHGPGAPADAGDRKWK